MAVGRLSRVRIAIAVSVPAIARTAVGAQVVHGVVTSDARPVAGAVLTLLDSAQHTVTRALSNEQGQYRLAAPGAGRYRIQSLRIGFRPTISDWFSLANGDDVARAIPITSIPVALDAIRVVDQRECRSASDSSAATFAVWEQARAALGAASVTTDQRTLVATKRVYDRTLDPSSRRIQAQDFKINTSVAAEPWRAANPDSLRRFGFVTTDSKGITTYNAPDIDVLLSENFTSDHCFQLVRSTDSSRIGLAFDPTPARKRLRNVAELRGTIWLDRASSELRAIEFGYTNLPVIQLEPSGGDVRFARLRDGSWTVAAWNLRMGVFANRARSSSPRSTIPEVAIQLTAIRSVGGDLVIATRGADTLFARPFVPLTGVVTDSVTRSPVAQALIGIVATPLRAITDSVGRFTIDGLLPGAYELEVHTLSLDSLGATSRFAFEFGDTAKRLDVLVPTAPQLAATLCAKTQNASTRGLLVGSITLPTDSARTPEKQDTRIVVRWSDSMTRDDRVREAKTTIDPRGDFRICSLPLDVPLTVRAEIGGKPAAGIELRIPSSARFARADLVPGDNRVGTLRGVIETDSTHVGVADAEITLPDILRSTRSDPRGAFRLDSVPPGNHRFVVRRIGYGIVDTTIAIESGEPTEKQVYLTRVVTLDSVRVTATERRMIDFEDNRRLGLGHFMARAQVEKFDGLPLTSMLNSISGSRIVTSGSHAAVASTRGKNTSLGSQILDAGPGGKRDCYSNVYIDGVLVFRAGRGDPYFDLATMTPDQIESVEFYAGPAETPARYNVLDSSCGTLVIHRRR